MYNYFTIFERVIRTLKSYWSSFCDYSFLTPETPKGIFGIFYSRLYRFLVISAPTQLLSSALGSAVSVYSDAACGLTCGQRALLDQAL